MTINLKKIFTGVFLTALVTLTSTGTVANRWDVLPSGAIRWTVDSCIPHYDHIEMSGEQMSVVLRYGVNADGSFSIERSTVFPMLRTIPNNTHASLTRRQGIDFADLIMVNGMTLNDEKVSHIMLDGKLTTVSHFNIGHNRGMKQKESLKPAIELTRVFFPSPEQPALCEQYSVKNISDKTVEVVIPAVNITYSTDPQKGVDGAYVIEMATTAATDSVVMLSPGGEVTFSATVTGRRATDTAACIDVDAERHAREKFIDEMWSSLQFVSPDTVLNTAFAFSKIRAAESIYRTRGGLMHGPGGEAYYAAIWANDQAEYINPFFPFLGYEKGTESAINSFDHFARFMNDDYRPIPSSIIAEGTDIWNGAGDRGDAAMIAYGASRFALAEGDIPTAEHLWELIEWCLEYCDRKLNSDGVVMSDTDELENRFPSGNANLCTSMLYYDALNSAAYLADNLKKKDKAKLYRRRAERLGAAVKDYFGATVGGFDTYRYYDGNDVLRSWICMPLVMDFPYRAKETVDALLSPALLTDDGLLSQAGSSTYWDRSTLYALRGIFAAGEKQRAFPFFRHYSSKRLLGEHVPYPIEAWPEGNQRHLSAESGLYCRIVTEGIFGIRPRGLHSFTMRPQLPDEWDTMQLNNIHAFAGAPFDIDVTRVNDTDRLEVTISRDGKRLKHYEVKNGKRITVNLPK